MVRLSGFNALDSAQRLARRPRVGVRPRWRLAAFFLFVAGCAASPVYVAKDVAFPQTVAVLPMENATNDLDGPAVVRKLLSEHIPFRGYVVMPAADVDAKLKEKGFTDGGQLRRLDPVKLGEWLGAEGLFYSTLEEFSYLNLGVYSHRRVKIYGRLVDAKTGIKLWEAERQWINPHIATNKEDITENFVIQIAAQAIERMAKVPLSAEALATVGLLLDTLPPKGR